MHERKVAVGILKLSLLGALGFGISGVLFFLVFYFLNPESLTSLVVTQGLCFVSAGIFLALAVAISNENLRNQKSQLIIWGGIGGFVYGGFSVFSIFGGSLGLALLGLCLAVPIQKWRIFLPFPVAILALFSLMWTSDLSARIVLHLLYPGAGIKMAPIMTLTLLAGLGYLLSCAVLAVLSDVYHERPVISPS